MIKAVSECIPNLKKAADSGKVYELNESLVNTVTVFSNSLREFSKNQLFDTQQEKVILSFLEALIYAFQSKTAKLEEFTANYYNISGLIRQPFILICSQNFTLQFPQKLWKVTACLISELFYYDNTDEWIYHIFLLFELKSPLEKQTSKEAVIQRNIEYLYSIIEDKYRHVANQWMYCLTQVIYTQISDYYIKDPPKYCILPTGERFPQQGIIDLNMSLLNKKWFLECFSITTVFISSFSFFAHIFAKLSEGFSKKYIYASNALAKLWIEYDPEVKEIIASQYQETPLLDDIFIIVNRYILTLAIKQLGIDPNAGITSGTVQILKKDVWKTFKKLRKEWLLLYQKRIDPQIFKKILSDIMLKFRPMFAPIALQLAYDMKSHDKTIWNYIGETLDKNQDLGAIPMQVFVSMLAANFAPIFLGFSKEEADRFTQKIQERKLRGSSIPESYLENLNILFNKPLSLLKFNTDLKLKYDDLMCKYPVRLFNPTLKDWNHESAFLFASCAIYIIEGNISPFLIMHFSVQDGVPIFLQRNPGFIVSEFIQSAIAQMDKQVDFQLLDALTRAFSIIGVQSKFNIPLVTQQQWFSSVSRLICSVSSMLVESGVRTALANLHSLAPLSLILAFQVLPVLIQNPDIVTFSELESFFLTAYNICSFASFPIEFKLSKQIQRWATDVKQTVVAQTQTLLESTDDQFPKKSILGHLNELYMNNAFNTLLCIYVEEAFKPTSQQKEMVSQFLSGYLLGEGCHIDPRMAVFMESEFNILSKSYPSFTEHFVEGIMRQLEHPQDSQESDTKSECSEETTEVDKSGWSDSRYLLTVALARLVSRGCVEWSDRVAACLSIDTLLVNCIPFIMMPRQSFANGIENPDLITTIGTETLIEAKNQEDDVFELATKQSMHSSHFTITALTFDDTVQEPEFPPEENNESDFYENNDNIDRRFKEFLTETMRVQPMSAKDFIQAIENADQIIDFAPIDITEEGIRRRTWHSTAEPILQSTARKCHSMTPFAMYALSRLGIPAPQTSPIAARHSRALMMSGCFEEIKIGVIYVSHDQFAQQAILGNVHRDSSLAFHRFLFALGEVVDMRRHGLYTGKLDAATSPFSVYYRDGLHDVMFHVSTLMKTSDSDSQQLLKKRHIGNDNVHIVWCENPQGYDTDTIASQFNDAHIVILPRGGGFFRVMVHRKKRKQTLGPLPADSIIEGDALAPLVRATAIFADRVTRAGMEAMPPKRFLDLIQPLRAE